MLFQRNYRLLAIIFLAAALFMAAGCSSSGNHEHDEGNPTHSHDDEEHDDSEPHGRIPNENGAAIRITAPTDGAVFQHGDQIVVEVETENFDLSQEGYHWHVYVDGSSWGMIMGGRANHVLNGVEPGEHEISAYLSIPSHEEYEDGHRVMITVQE